MRIVNAISSQNPPGRFLEFDSHLSDWKIICNKRAIEKTSQALREGNTTSYSKPSSVHAKTLEMPKNKKKQCNKKILAVPNTKLEALSKLKVPAHSYCRKKKDSEPNKTTFIPASTPINVENNNSSVNLPLYNNIILANLQKDYSNGQKTSHCPNPTCEGKNNFFGQVKNVQAVRSSDNSILCHRDRACFETVTNNFNCTSSKANDELDDYILMAFDFSNEYEMEADIQKSTTVPALMPHYSNVRSNRLASCSGKVPNRNSVASSAA